MTTRVFTLVTGCCARQGDGGLGFAIRELVPDERGEIVIRHQAGTEVTVLTDDPIIAHGIERDHITRAGHDVSGFSYCRFAGGIAVFYPRSLSLCVDDGEPV
ncbi:MAG TPA: hypothetical protein VN728_04570 [Stellaceae bacterium]|jgi:hypothetical protein|nr:hypothetical protein [Stellaceae bacterium]